MGNLSIWHAPNVSAAANISLWGSWASCFCHLSRSKPYVVGANLMTLKSELEQGEKVIKVQVQSDPSFVHHILICYSSSTYSGTSFLLPNFEELKRWAEELNIYTYEALDSEGELISVEHFEE